MTVFAPASPFMVNWGLASLTLAIAWSATENSVPVSVNVSPAVYVPAPENWYQMTLSVPTANVSASSTVATQPVPLFSVPSVTNWNAPGISDDSLKYSPRVSSHCVDPSPTVVTVYEPFSNVVVWSLTSTISPIDHVITPSTLNASVAIDVITPPANVALRFSVVAASAAGITLNPWATASTYDLVAASCPVVGFKRLVILELLTSKSLPNPFKLTPSSDSILRIPVVVLIVRMPTSPPIEISLTTILSSMLICFSKESVPPGCKK